jgi:hypothetical protein
MAASDQIRQMVNFILQEAHEKANEIRVKVGYSCRSTISVMPSSGNDLLPTAVVELYVGCTPPDL